MPGAARSQLLHAVISIFYDQHSSDAVSYHVSVIDSVILLTQPVTACLYASRFFN